MTKKKRVGYTAEFKADAIDLVLKHGYSCSEVARRLGVPRNNIHRWVLGHRKGSQKVDETGKTLDEVLAENRQLKKENQRLEMEREILKKAAAFFAKESK
jgi:transposase